MVLENASASTVKDAFEDSAPASDDDPYSGTSSSNSTAYNIDTSNFPKPMPIFGRLLGYTDQFYARILQEKVAKGSQSLNRPLTQEEVNAFGYWTAKQISIYSYGAPIGTAGGLWRAYSSADKFRFPFYQPNLEKFQAEVFPPRVGIVRGVRAVIAWHALRAFCYGAAGNWFGQLFFGSYSMSVAAVGELSDKRLKPFVDAARAQAQQKAGSLPKSPWTPSKDQQQAGADVGGSQKDDASPTGGMFFEENNPETSGGRYNVEEDGKKRQWPPTRPASAQTRTGDTGDQPFGIFDDASPTGGQGVTADTRPASQGSAWDRLRRGEKPVPSSQRSRSNEAQQEQKAARGDSLAFSKAEEERSYAKDEAQKEFDARVERERRGGDFAQGSGDQRRW